MYTNLLIMLSTLPVFPDIIESPVEKTTRVFLSPLFWVLAALLVTLIILRRKLNDK